MRALGASRAHIALAVGLPGMIAVLGGAVLAVAGAVALSPLAPVGPVRRYDPDRGFHADWAIAGTGAALFIVVLLGLLAVLAVRSVRPRASQAEGRSIGHRPGRRGRRTAAVRGRGRPQRARARRGVRSVPVRSTLLGSIIAVAAVVSAVVFGASLTGLISHPVRYGWNWNVIIQAEGGYGSFNPAIVNRVMHGQRAVRGLVGVRVHPAQRGRPGPPGDRDPAPGGHGRAADHLRPAAARPGPDRAGHGNPGRAGQEGRRHGPDRQPGRTPGRSASPA